MSPLYECGDNDHMLIVMLNNINNVGYCSLEDAQVKEYVKGEVILVAVNSVPVWEKANLNLEEAAAYFGIGINKLRDMTNENNCPFVLWNGNKRLIKRRAFERFLDSSYSI